MAEYWRYKSYYSKRVLISTERIITPQFDDIIVCLTGAQLEMLRNLTQYLHRRTTFAEEETTQNYLTPTNDDWDSIQSVVSDLEDKLMGCDMDTLVAAIEALTTCVCSIQTTVTDGTPLPVTTTGTELAPTLGEETSIHGVGVPIGTDDMCGLANVIVGFTFEFITETLLPFANAALDATAAAVAATTLFSVLSGGLGIGVALVTALFHGLVQYLADQSTSNIINWMFGNAQELVCVLFEGFKFGGFNTAMLSMTDYIDDSGLPLGDRMMLKLTLTSTWFYRAMEYQVDQGDLTYNEFINYACSGCVDNPFEYFWSGAGCPAGSLTGSRCQDGYPVVDVTHDAETEAPFVVFSPGDTTARVYWSASPNAGIGGTFRISMWRTSPNITIETYEFSVIPTGGLQYFDFEFTVTGAYTVYFGFGSVGASAAYFYWAGCDVS